jgi:hypothetical protein
MRTLPEYSFPLWGQIMNCIKSALLNCPALLLSFLSLNSTLLSSGLQGTQESKAGEASIELRLSVQKKVIRPGGSLEVRVEIWNTGSRDIFVGQNLDRWGSISELSLRLEGGIEPTGPGRASAGDSLHDPNFVNVLTRYWLPLPPGHFYGRVVKMYPDSFPKLDKRGRYRLKAEYSCIGFPTGGINGRGMNGFELDPEQSAKLPSKAWKGKIESNSVLIVVAGTREE